MQILVVEACLEQRRKLHCALELCGQTCDVKEIDHIREISPTTDIAAFRIAVIGTDDLADALAGIVFLRGRMPAGRIIAYGQFSALDSETPARIRAAGADAVLDSRFNPSKLALLIDRFNQTSQRSDENPAVKQNWIIRGAMRMLAPAAHQAE